MLKFIFFIKNKLLAIIEIANRMFKKERKFAKRIKLRHNTFWNSPDAEIVRNTSMSADQPFNEWKDIKYWQRKLSNKYNSREFAKLHNCRVPELYWKGRNIAAINFDQLPLHYVIRPTIGHSCNLVFLMANSVNFMDKQTYQPEDIKSLLSKALEENEYVEFLFEEFIKTEEGEYKIPDDYKFYMFNGEIARILVINRKGPKEGRISAYDKDWNIIESAPQNKYAKAEFQQPPNCFNEMTEQAKTLSRSYEIFVRIDFYATDKGAVFGEFTPTPGLGKDFSPKVDKLLLKYWNKFCKGKI